MYYIMTICCLRESKPPSNDKDNDGDDDNNREIPNMSEVLRSIKLCRLYLSASKNFSENLKIH